MTVLPSANRDERRYAQPGRFDITRDAADHLGFGGGVHRCVGGNLAMLELTVTLEAIVREVREIELIGSVRADSTMLCGFAQLHLCLIAEQLTAHPAFIVLPLCHDWQGNLRLSRLRRSVAAGRVR